MESLPPQYRERIYRLLGLYEQAYEPLRAMACIDEKSKQLLAQKRTPMAIKTARPARCDYEYSPEGTRNIFVAFEPKPGTRTVRVTKTRKKADFPGL